MLPNQRLKFYKLMVYQAIKSNYVIKQFKIGLGIEIKNKVIKIVHLN
jgi:hypothetical protein